MTVKQRILPAVLLSLGVCVGLLPLVQSQARSIHGEVNPQVKPGDVAWHSNFAAACEASKQSGKPVLLFQLLGKLDEEFC
jgi:hypothetical protein